MSKLISVINNKITAKQRFKSQQDAEHLKEIIDKEIILKGITMKEVMREDELLTLTFLFTDKGCFYTSATSIQNTANDLADIFKDDIEGNGLKCKIVTVKTRSDNTIYKVEII